MSVRTARVHFRKILSGAACVAPASVFDPMSARLAEGAGCEALLLAGSVASMAVLAAPDLTLITLSELADLARRICRAAQGPLLVDADHGYGGALNAMRTVQELEAAGVAALTIEDTALPQAFGRTRTELISVEEGVAKLRAAVAARSDLDLAIIARTSVGAVAPLNEALNRMRIYAQTGVDAAFFAGITERRQVEAIHRALDLPILLGGGGSDLNDLAWLGAQGVRLKLQGHEPYVAALAAARDVYARSAQAGARSPVDRSEMLKEATHASAYADWRADFLGLGRD